MLASGYVGYDFDDLDWQGIHTGLETLTSEADTFSYPIIGQQELNLTLSTDPDNDEITLRITGRPDRLLQARIAGLIDALALCAPGVPR